MSNGEKHPMPTAPDDGSGSSSSNEQPSSVYPQHPPAPIYPQAAPMPMPVQMQHPVGGAQPAQPPPPGFHHEPPPSYQQAVHCPTAPNEAQNPSYPKQDSYPPYPVPPGYGSYPAATTMGAPYPPVDGQQRPVVVHVVQQQVPNGIGLQCAHCVNGTVIRETDMCCLLCLILLAIFTFPFGLIFLCCVPCTMHRKCNSCGRVG